MLSDEDKQWFAGKLAEQSELFERKFAEQSAQIATLSERIDGLENALLRTERNLVEMIESLRGEMDSRFESVNQSLERIEARLARLRIARLEGAA